MKDRDLFDFLGFDCGIDESHVGMRSKPISIAPPLTPGRP